MNPERKDELIIFIIFFLIFAIMTKSSVETANDASRIATIESLVERGTLKIDDSNFIFSGDKAYINGHFYSDKSPLVSLIGAAIYYPLHKLGLNFVKDSYIIFYEGEKKILLEPSKNFFPYESWNGEYYKKFFDNATLILRNQKLRNTSLTFYLVAPNTSNIKKLELYLNNEFVTSFNIKPGIYNYTTPTLQLKVGKNYLRFHSDYCGKIEMGVPCDIHFYVDPIKFTAYYWVTLFMVGTTSSLLLVVFYKSLKFVLPKRTLYKDLLVITLGTGSLISIYTVTMNEHTIAALFLFLSFYYLLKARYEKNKKTNVFLSGLFASISVFLIEFYFLPVFAFFFIYTFLIGGNKKLFNIFFVIASILFLSIIFSITDIFKSVISIGYINYIIISSIIPFLAFTIFIRKNNPYPLMFLIGSMMPIIIFIVYNFYISGNLLPFYFFKEKYYYYLNSPWLHLAGWDKFTDPKYREPKTIYTYNILFGHHGLFLITPILLFAIYSLIKIPFTKKNKLYYEGRLILVSFIILLIFFVFHTHNYSGSAYAFRYFIPVIPILFFFLGYFLNENKSKTLLTLFFIFLAISVYMSLVGMKSPWIAIPYTNNIIWQEWSNFTKTFGLSYNLP